MARRSRRKGRNGQRGPNVPLLLTGAIISLAAIGGAGWYLRSIATEFETDPETGCLNNREAPEAVLFLVDATDKLTAENAERIKTHITDVVSDLPRYSKVIVVPFGEDLAAPLEPLFDLCVPGRAGEERLDEGGLLLQQRFNEFEEVISDLATRLTQVPDASSSPITSQVVRAASDDTLHWDAEKRMLVLITDGLQSSIHRDTGGRLPPPPSEDFLNGVQVDYFEVGNQQYVASQTRQLRQQWGEWFVSAGATVEINAPGFM